MFRFKQFIIRQDRTAMKVGTDGVLLGAWAPLQNDLVHHVLDIGTGTGLISLMIAQRYPTFYIDAIDIDGNSFEQAIENIQNSIFAERINTFLISLQNFHPSHLYDAIVCNPPFFVNSLHCPDSHRTMARHADSLPLDELLSHSERLLSDSGSLSLILPDEQSRQLLEISSEYNLYPHELLYVHPVPGSPAKRVLMHLIKHNNYYSVSPSISHIDIELSRHVYTPEYIALTRDFYLKM